MQEHHKSIPTSDPQLPIDEFICHASEHVEQMLKAGVSRCEILTRLARAGEVLAGPDASVSILVLDDDGLLRNGASPNLPSDYLNAIDRLKPDAKVGTCAAAAATGSVVMTPDFFADDKCSVPLVPIFEPVALRPPQRKRAWNFSPQPPHWS